MRPPKLGAARGSGPRLSQLGGGHAGYSSARRCAHGIPTWLGVPRLIPQIMPVAPLQTQAAVSSSANIILTIVSRHVAQNL